MKNNKNNQVKDLKFDTVKSPRKLNKIKVALLSTLFLIAVLGGYKAIQFSYNYFHSHTYIKLNVQFKVELPKMITNEEYQKQLDQDKQVDEMSKKAIELLKKDSSFNLVKPVLAEEIDLIQYFRDKGKKIGYSDTDITKFHQVMDNENGLHTADRKNYLYDGENGRYTAAGFAMITKSSFKHYGCTGNRFNGIDNINCFYKIIGKNRLNDYKASENKWGKLFDKNTIAFIKVNY